jgi:hypothetical protein
LSRAFAWPGGNATGINYLALEVLAKRLALLHALAPKATRVAILVNPANGPSAKLTLQSVEGAARSVGPGTRVLKASTSDEIDAVFASFADEGADDVLFVAADGFFQSRGRRESARASWRVCIAAPRFSNDSEDGSIDEGSAIHRANERRESNHHSRPLLRPIIPCKVQLLRMHQKTVTMSRRHYELPGHIF